MKKLLIKNATIIDGTGRRRFKSDILLEGGRIVEVSQNIDLDSGSVIECRPGQVVTPGFIDVHSHGDFALFYDPAQKVKLFQGITTEIEGNCGVSAAPVDPEYIDFLMSSTGFLTSENCIGRERLKSMLKFSDYLREAGELDLGINTAFLIGHGTLRIAAMGMDNRKPTPKELDKMQALLAEGLEHGAFGLSSGLIYPPGVFAEADELAALCEIVKQYGGIYATHMRNESFKLLQSVEETIALARLTGCKVQISHHKVCAKEHWGDVVKSLEMIERANEQGTRITADAYPYTACSTSLTAMIPPEYHAGGRLVERLKDKALREEIAERILSDNSWDNIYMESGFENVLIASSLNTPDAMGKTLTEYAELTGKTEMDTLFDVLIENNGDATCVEFCMSEADVEYVLKHPITMIGSDSGVDLPGLGYHPRTTGTFPRVLGRYARDRGIFSLEEAVRKMTSFPADTFGIPHKGRIEKGFDADLVIFDPETIADKSDYASPSLQPEGIEYIILGGEITVNNNTHTPAKAYVTKFSTGI